MKIAATHHHTAQRESGLTLIEILVASALLMALILGLTVMFNETQRAFRTSLKNADVYEGSRATIDLIARDLEQLKNNSVPSTNFHSYDIPSPFAGPVIGLLPGDTTKLQEICFLTQISNRWIGVGYRLGAPFLPDGVGQLFRYMTNYSSAFEAANLVADFNSTPLTSDRFRHVADGVVHMRFMPFSTNGFSPYDPQGFVKIDSFPPGTYAGPDTNFFDFSNSVPAYVQIELGMLESPNFEQFKVFPDHLGRTNYLLNHAHKVHVFRQQVPVRSVYR